MARMQRAEWQIAMEGLISGIERELRSRISARTRLALNAFRVRLKGCRIAARRKRFEQDLESFIGGDSAVRAAAKRHLGAAAIMAIERATTALKRAEKVLAQSKARVRTL